MKKGFTKRSFSMFMAVMLMLGTVVTALPAGLFTSVTEAEAAVSYSPDKAGARILPSSAYNNGRGYFMNTYVFGDGSYSLNSNFKAKSWSDNVGPSVNSSSTLDFGSTYHKKNDDCLWYAEWKYSPNTVMKDLMSAGQIQFGYYTKMSNDYHSHFGRHGKRWNKAVLTITNDSKKELKKLETENKNDEQAQTQKGIFSVESSSYFLCRMGNESCKCNNSKVGSTAIYAVDYYAPKITECYITDSDKDSAEEINSATKGFKSGDKGYLVLKFSESIRFATNSASALTLNLDAYWKDTKQSAGTVTAQLVKLTGKKMIFSFTVPEKMTKKNEGSVSTDVLIQSISMPSGNSAWAGSGKSYSLNLLNASGGVENFDDDKLELTATSMITDLAGNGLDWSASKKELNNPTFLDNVESKIEKVNLTVDKKTVANVAYDKSELNENEGNSSNVYGAVGDKVYLSVTFNDKLSNAKASNIKATLNVKNGSGYVTLKASKVSHNQQTETDAGYGEKTKIEFETLTITSGMYQVGGLPIKITSLSGMESVKDICGNALSGVDNITVAASDNLLIDRVPPTAVLGLEPASGIYTPTSSADGQLLTIPVSIDNTKETEDSTGAYCSGITGILAKFKWVCDGKYRYEYYCDNKAAVSDDANWRELYTATSASDTNSNVTGSFIQYAKENGNYYIHIRLKDDVKYGATANKGKIDGNLVIETMDFAGNKGTNTFALSHMADKTAPTLERKGSSIDGNAQRTEATVTATIKASDDYGVQSVTYEWSGQSAQQYDMAGVSDNTQFEIPISGTYNDADAVDDQKEVSLKVTITDYAGHTTEQTYNYTLYFGKIENRYSFDGGTAAQPVIIPVLNMKQPDAITSVGGGSTDLFSYVEVKFGDGNSYVYKCTDTDEVDVFQQTGWYYVTSMETSASGGTTLTYTLAGTVGEQTVSEALQQKISECYGTGEMTVTVRTVDTFTSSTDSLVISYESLDAIAVNEHSDIYIARSGNYGVTVDSILDEVGADAGTLLAFDQEKSEQTAYSLDGVSFRYTITGENEDRFDYNFADIDVANSYVELMKTSDGTKHAPVTATAVDASSQDTACERFELSAVREQGFTISSDVSETNGTGWYYLRFVVQTTDGNVYVTYYNDIFVDRYVYSGYLSYVYNKSYTKSVDCNGEKKEVTYTTARDLKTQDDDDILGIGIAPIPDGYTLSQNFKFQGPGLTSDDAITSSMKKFRVYNQADASYETNCPWQKIEEDQSGYFTLMFDVQEATMNDDGGYIFDESSYYSDGHYYVPVTEGVNVICYEVQTMNGQITRDVVVVNAKKDTILKDYVKEQSNTQAQWTLSETAQAENPYAVMKVHEYYGDNDAHAPYDYSNTITASESGSWEFVLYNEYGLDGSVEEYNDNLVTDVMEIEGVDGIEPSVSNVEFEQDGMNFCYKFTVTDDNALNLVNLAKLDYDYQYAYMLRKANGTLPEETEDEDEAAEFSETDPDDNPDSGEDSDASDSSKYEDTRIEYDVPFTVTDDVSGSGIWTDYGTNNYGIYKTQIDWNEDRTEADVCIWGAFMYQENEAEGKMLSCSMGLDIYDANGNWTYQGDYFNYENEKPVLEINGSYEADSADASNGNLYAYDGTTCFDADDNLVAECSMPLSRIQTYGAGSNYAAISENEQEMPDIAGELLTAYSPYEYHFLNSIPMIRNVGQYEMEYEDIFGNTYTQTLDTSSAYEEGSDRIKINYSSTTLTNQNVTVMANLVPATGEAIDTEARITTITALTANADGSMTAKEGEIDIIDNTAARMIMENNGEVYIEGFYGGQKVSKTAKVSNIDKEIEEVTPIFLYGEMGDTEPIFMEGSDDTVDGAVKVVLSCAEDIEGINGDTKYIFPIGSRKGDKYTFEYVDNAGNTASTTAVLPYNIDKSVPPEPDTEAPEVVGIISGLRHSYAALAGIFDRDEDGNTSEVQAANAVMESYVARGYKMAFEVTDESKVKLVAKNAGAQAPTSYDDSGDSVDGLRIMGYTVEVTKPAQFDLYFVDTEGNVKALKGFDIDSFDQEVAEVEVQYKVLRNDEDIAFVRAYLVADPAEEIVATNLDATTFMNEEAVSGEATQLVKRYYRDFYENESYIFTYEDVYGNTGYTTAEVKGFDYGAPSELGIQWFGTSRRTDENVSSAVMNESPDTEGLSMVNSNITAEISYNKAISGVKLYAYDETQENGLGIELTSADAVSASYVGKNVTVTYENNYNQKVVVSAQAKNSGKRTYSILPAVQCIDKQAPSITVDQGILSQNKRSMTYTITTDEETFINNETEKALQHTYVADNNGAHEIRIKDIAGNISTYTIQVSEIDDKAMELTFGIQPDGSDMTTDVESLELKTNDTLYVKSTKEAQVVLGDGSLHLVADKVGSISLSSEAGMHLLRAVDASTGEEQVYKILMIFRDRSAPIIAFEANVLSFPVETAKETIDEAVRNGITVEDNKDGIIDSSKVVINDIPEKWTKGIHTLTYQVSDSEGNTAYATRSVYVYEKGTPNIQINGLDAMPYGTTIVNSSTIHVKASDINSGAVLVKYRAGIKTAAQMKYGTTGAMLTSASRNEEQTFVLPQSSGFYTVYVRTQDRKEQITYVYVDLSE